MSEFIEYCTVDRDDLQKDDVDRTDKDFRVSFQLSKPDLSDAFGGLRPLPKFCRGGLRL